MFGAVVAVYAVQATLWPRAEETGNRAEPVLATAATRVGWVGGHALCAAAGSAVVLAAGGLGAGLTHGLRTGDLGTAVPQLVGAALVPLPAVWLLRGWGWRCSGSCHGRPSPSPGPRSAWRWSSTSSGRC
jgi:ABC-2 type transport system permease protein